MNKKKNSQILIFAIFTIGLIISSCSKKIPNPKWIDDNVKIESPQNNISIDVYLDATTSMGGFAVGSETVFSQFIDQLDASAFSAWKSVDIKYYKFGEIIKNIDRSNLLSARNNQSFYKEKGIFERTYIDSVVKRTDVKRLSIVITDLFQDEGDVNIMVDKIKNQCFNKHIMVSILGLKSKFNGYVFDTPNNPRGYKLKTDERPFYAMVFGNQSSIEKLYEALKVKDFVKENQILFISDNIFKSSSISVIKTRDSKFVNKVAPRTQLKNSFDFSMKNEGKDAKFDFEMIFDRNTRCADFMENSIFVNVYKKSIKDALNANPDSVSTNDIIIENVKRQGNKLTATLILHNEDPVGNYSYLIYLQPNQISGFNFPKWVHEFSTDNPLPNTPSASQTYNLENLISRLLVAKNSVMSTNISKCYINIYKR